MPTIDAAHAFALEVSLVKDKAGLADLLAVRLVSSRGLDRVDNLERLGGRREVGCQYLADLLPSLSE